MMVSLSANCPKCRHVFPVVGAAGGCAGAPCRPLSLALSGGRLLSGGSSPLSTHSTHYPHPQALKPPPPEQELFRLTRAVTHLRQSGWYYEDLTWQASLKALSKCSKGTFLVRDSGDHNYLFSLSVQTSRGPTSVRLHYAGGLFRLDAEPGLAPLMPQFDCVVKLVEHYVEVTRAREGGARGPGHVWVDSTGGQHSPVLVRKPLLRAPSSLAHLARLAVNRAVRAAAPPALPLLPPLRQLGLPTSLQDYLQDYPFTC